MPRLQLSGGAYQARSVIASAQRSLNLFAEPMPQGAGEPSPYAYYPTPGLTLLGTLTDAPIRAIRQATSDNIFICAGSGIYVVNSLIPLVTTRLGSINPGTTPVSMQDNSETLVIVDGSSNGWQVDLATNTFSAISDPTGMFSGADRVDYLDTYLLFNKPGTPQFYASLSLSTSFDTLYFANKSSYPDLLVLAVVAKREIWLLGERTTEVWYNAGTSDFPFGQMPATFVDHGCIAKYSPATYDNKVFWLTLDRQGGPVAMEGAGYQTQRVSTFAVEQIWADYPTVADAIGFFYQSGGHIVYVLTFPSADATWCFDTSTQLWHEWLWLDGSGNEHRSRCMCAYGLTSGKTIAGDWENGNLYQIDNNNYTDNGAPIKRQRAWQHVSNDGKRVFHREFIADFETGMDGPLPDEPQQLIVCLLNGPDGSPVEDYQPSPVEVNATWSLVSGASAVFAEGAAVASNGAAIYVSEAPFPPIADYSIAFRVLPNALATDGSSALVAARAVTLPVLSGYYAGIQVYGDTWWAQLGGHQLPLDELPLGQPPPDGWFDCKLAVVGSNLALTVQRSGDGLYAAPDGTWQAQAVAALTSVDTTYTAAGQVMFGLNGIPTGVMGTEDPSGSFTWVLEDGSGSSWEWTDSPLASLLLDNIVVTTIPSPWQLMLDWSDDRGHTYGNPVPQSMGGQGSYLKQAQWQRLGMARDRVFRLTWTAPIRTALQGAWIEAQPALS